MALTIAGSKTVATSELEIAEKTAKAVASAKAQPTAKAATTPKDPKAAGTPRDMTSLDAKFFVLEGDAAAMSDEDLSTNKATVMAGVPRDMLHVAWDRVVTITLAAASSPPIGKARLALFGIATGSRRSFSRRALNALTIVAPWNGLRSFAMLSSRVGRAH